MPEQLQRWVSRFAWWEFTTLIAGGLTWAGWVTIAIADRPTVEITRHMLTVEAPYVQDRKQILESLNDTKLCNRELRKSIDNNTKAIIQLQAVLEAALKK